MFCVVVQHAKEEWPLDKKCSTHVDRLLFGLQILEHHMATAHLCCVQYQLVDGPKKTGSQFIRSWMGASTVYFIRIAYLPPVNYNELFCKVSCCLALISLARLFAVGFRVVIHIMQHAEIA